jgi:hypothetical protein
LSLVFRTVWDGHGCLLNTTWLLSKILVVSKYSRSVMGLPPLMLCSITLEEAWESVMFGTMTAALAMESTISV